MRDVRGEPGAAPLRVAVRVRPGASRTRVGGAYDGRFGPAVVVAVAAPPVDGRANAAVVAAVAAAFAVRRSDVAVVTGHTGRDKVLEVSSPPSDAAATLAALRDG